MKVRATIQRLSGASLFYFSALCFLVPFLSGCVSNSRSLHKGSAQWGNAGVSSQTATTNSSPQSVKSADAQALPLALDNSSSRTLLEPSAGTFGLEFVNADTINQLIVRGTVANTVANDDFKVTRLNAPARLIIDLAKAHTKINRAFETPEAEFISRVRVGAHPDSSRIVLDLTKESDLSHYAELRGGNLIVTVGSENAIRAARERASSVAARANTDKDGVEKTDTLAASSHPGESLEAAAPNTPKASSELNKKAQLVGLSLESLGNESIVVAHVKSGGAYTLSKTAPSEYVLTLKKTTLDPEVAHPIVSTSENGLIRSVRPIAKGDDLLLRIFAAPEAGLVAEAKQDKIIVRPGVAGDDAASRAQFAPEAGKTEEKKAEEAAKPEVVSKPNPATEAGAPAELGTAGEEELRSLLAEAPRYTGRLISLDLQDTDIDNALRIIAEVSNLNIIASDDVTGKVTLRLIDVPWDQALDVILKTNGLDKVQEGNVIRIAPVEKLRQEREALKQAQQAEEELEPLQVRYIRISYAKASELKALVETVLSERGTVAYDERSNQLIVKDIRKGIRNVAELISKLDLRTPQVLLETQIVEANRNLLRELGSEVGFRLIQSPATGNATGNNFPNSVNIGGSVDGANPNSIVGSSFPAAIATAAGSAVSFLLDSADGTQSLDVRLSSLEQEGRVRVVSRPSVATTNNKQALIKSVEKIRIHTPDGGLSVATGQGATASGGSAIATEIIEVGITLEVTPQASPDYYVLLDIKAKSSDFGAREVEGIPSEIERSANSSILVSSGQTFAMGGIYRIRDNDRVSGVPFFKDIPFLGHLFRGATVNNSDEELLFFITPRIIEGSFDDATMKVAS